MLDDSASDNSSTPQTREVPNPSLSPAPTPVADRTQDRGPNPDVGPKNANLQQMLSTSDEEDINVQDMQMVGQESNQQQTLEMSNQLQVSVMVMTRNQPPASPFFGGPTVKKQTCMHRAHVHNWAATDLSQHMTYTRMTQG